MSESLFEGIAIIGVHGRFPGAQSAEQFWRNLVDGVETVSCFTDAELAAAGLDAEALRRGGEYVPARGILQDAECFDAAFFGVHPKEAEVMDPQQRVFLEGCWEALERAGYAPGRIGFPVGVYAGATYNTYYMHALHPRPGLIDLVGREQVMFGNEKDYMATRAAYKLDLKGPAITLNTACSSSLTAICQACQALLIYQIDMAIAGGVSVTVPQKRGYYFEEGNIGSPDGHTRSFDARAQGTVFSNGLALVVLKRLEDARADGDQIYAVIKGFALNNDGSQRVSFGAPGVPGQSAVVALAQEMAGVEPDDIGFIEAHGTATPVGDPIEVAALTEAFRRKTQRRRFCALGTVKTNVGHLDAAAGAAGLIKTALALTHGQIPASLHFTHPNPRLELDESPFFVNPATQPWARDPDRPRSAGVSSFGTGGTNAHVVVQEAPPAGPDARSRPFQLLLVSAKTAEALEAGTRNLAAHLKSNPDVNLADAAFTLQVGRSQFVHRRALVCRDVPDAQRALEALESQRVLTAAQDLHNRPVAFMFPGQGAQQAGMGAELYRHEAAFRETVDECADLLAPWLGQDLRADLFPAPDREEAAQDRLRQTRLTQPALFVMEYALARLLMSWGIRPAAMIGHSVGEYVAGCLAGVFSLQDALRVVARRAELVQAMPAGAMLSVRISESDLLPMLNDSLAIAAVNSPQLCVVSGPFAAIESFERLIAEKEIAGKRLRTSHAFHSFMMEPVLAPFTELMQSVSLAPPQIPFVSNVTGQWVRHEEATSPDYWARHVRQTVRFADGVAKLMSDPQQVLVEVGPGQTLTQLACQHSARQARQPVIPTLKREREQEYPGLLTALGRLWLEGVDIDWRGYYAGEKRRRVVLPTYPFERRRIWPDAPVTRPEPSADSCPGGPAVPARIAQAAAPSAETAVDDSRAQPPAPVPPQRPISRKEHLASLITAQLEELSGAQLESAGGSHSFLELGLDSLLLTQAANLFKKKFGVKVTFRQLMEDLCSADALAFYLDERLAAGSWEPAVPPAPAPLPTAAARPVSPAGGAVPSVAQDADLVILLEQQQRLTSQLLSALQRQADRHGSPPAAASALAVEDGKAIRIKAPEGLQAGHRSHGPYRPADHSRGAQLTERQQRHLDRLVARYTRKTASSRQMAGENRPVLADPRSATGFKSSFKEMIYPIYTHRSDGSRLWDIDGNEYVDFVMGFGASLFGHRPRFVVEALKAQLDAGFEIGPIHPMAGEVAGLIRELTGAERVAFCNTGSEAVLAAIRVARTVSGRDRIAMFAGSYHGIFDEVLARPLAVNGELRSAPAAPGIPQGALGQICVLEYGHPESLEILKDHGHEFAAVLVEPVQARRLDLQPREFLEELRRITASTETALVFDEVVTGFRVHPGGAQAYFGIRADLATYGKVVGGGLPIGIVTGKARYLDALDGGPWQYGDDSSPEVGVTFFAGTFVRHPLALAAARAVLTHLKEQGPQVQARTAERAERVAAAVREMLSRYQAPYRLSQFSSLMYLETTPEFAHGGLLFYHLRERGIHIWENRVFVFTTAHTDEDEALLLQAMEGSLQEMRDGGFLPGAGPAESGGTSAGSAEAPAGEASRWSAAGETSPVPLTQAQQEIWLAAEMGEEAFRAYNTSFIVCLRGLLNRQALESSLQELVNRHDSLRTAFDVTHPVQRFVAHLNLATDFVDLSSYPQAEREDRFAVLARRQADQHFDISIPPLFRVQLVRLASEEHRVVLTVSHLVADGWSVGVLMHELKMLFKAHGEQAPTAWEPALQFRQYLRLLEGPEHRAAEREAERYWRERFSALPAPLELPVDRPRPPQRTYRAARVSVAWDEEFTQRLRKASAAHRTTLLNFLLGGFKALLHRLSGQSDLVVGIPAAGQIAPALEATEGSRALVGHCVNLLPVRSRCDGEQTFEAYLRSLKTAVLDAYEHQSLTFGRLLQMLNVPRETNRMPLVPVIFNVDRTGSGFGLHGLDTTFEELSRSSIVFDVFCNVVDHDTHLQIDCEFNTDIFEAATIRRWLEYYRNLLTQAAARPEVGMARVGLMSEAERQQLLVEWNDTAVEYPRERRVEELFALQVHQHPDRVAVEFEDRRFTYAELDRQSTALAGELHRAQLAPGALVGLCMRRSLDMVVGILAILKAGGAFLPLDPEFPDERLGFMIDDSGTGLILTQSELRPRFSARQVSTICVDQWHPVARAAVEPPRGAWNSEAVAYVIYTSGSTGKPKGVQLTHRSLVNLLNSIAREPGFTARDVMLAVTTVSFDIAMAELFLPLTTGGRLVVASQEAVVDGRRLGELLETSGATFMQPTPVTWRMLLQAGWQGSDRLKMISTGEALPRDLAQELLPRGQSLWNLYGPTETTIWSTGTRVETAAGPISIGRPIDNTQIYILDDLLQPVPVGVPGNLYIGGDGLACGYWNRPELTAERFLAHPFRSRPGDRIYKTGDVARYLPNGQIEFLGRKDNQVKVRGYRIELDEIEAVLALHPGVQESAVVAREFAPGDVRLVAYLIGRPDASLATGRLQAMLREKLPDYMVPSALITVDALPRTPNGKIDRKGLVLRAVEVARTEQRYRAPSDEVEQHFTRLWEGLLGTSPIGVNDDFFELGGHSLLGVRLMVQIEQTYGRRLPLATLLQTRTIAGLAEILRAEHWKPNWDCLVPIRPGGSKPPLFLIHAAGGNVLVYEDLARHLDAEQPVYGIQARGLDGKEPLPATAEEMAASYREEIQRMQPTGPYLLGGYCLGGTVALEVATQLYQQGHQVAFLGMLDAHNWARVAPGTFWGRCLYYLQKADFHLRNWWRLPAADRRRFFLGKLTELRRRVTVWRDTLVPRGRRAKGGMLADRSLAVLWNNNDRIAAQYVPRPYPGRITQFCPVRNYSELNTPDVGWEDLALGGVDVHTLSVYPAGMLMEPYVAQLAREIQGAMEQGLRDIHAPADAVEYEEAAATASPAAV